jgi:hypothetical protein
MPDSQKMEQRKDTVMRTMEAVPTQIYWALAMGSVLISALFYVGGRRNTALFVGQWPPTFLALALLYKLLRPSQEAGTEGLRDAMHEVSATAS